MEDNKTDKSVIESIKLNYDNLFMAEKKVADFILQNPEKAVNANVSELAKMSDVSDATVIRLCKHIGYQGYYQLRISLSRELGWTFGKKDTKDNTVNAVFKSLAYQIISIGKINSDKSMKKCVQMIKNCNYMHIVAVGNTNPLAQYFGFRLGRLGIRCTYPNMSEYILNNINLAQKNDIVFAISQSGSSKQVVQALELAKKRGLETIAITGCEYSPVSNLADCLILSNSGQQAFDYYKEYSHLKGMAVIDAIVHFVTDEKIIKEKYANEPEIILSETKL